jgi:hypothetical protein
MCGHSSAEWPRPVQSIGLHHYEKCYSGKKDAEPEF